MAQWPDAYLWDVVFLLHAQKQMGVRFWDRTEVPEKVDCMIQCDFHKQRTDW